MFRLGHGLGLSSFSRERLIKDVVAGIVLTTLLVPQGMAYAELAGLPAITGLYTSILCLLGYAVVGPSRILVLGPDSALGSMIAATILPLAGADGDPEKAIALASVLALIVGAIMVLGAVARLGFIADLISKPTMIGYMNGLALTILVGQLPKLFGFKVDADGFIGELTGFVKGLADGKAVAASAAVGIAGIVVILVLQRWLPKIPAVLVAVVLTIAATSVFSLAEHGVSLVGTLPKGFPPLTIPDIRLSDLGPLFAGAVGIALVSLADTISTSSVFAARHGQQIDGNGEMIGIGVANLAAGLFQGFPVSTSGSRTAVAERSGARTQLTGVTGAALIILMIVFVPGPVPEPAAACPGRGGHHGVAVPGRHPRHGAAVAAAEDRVHAVDRGVRSASSCSAFSRGSRSRSACRFSTCSAGRGGRTRRCSAAWTGSRATTTGSPIRPPASCRAWRSTGSTHRCSSPTPRRSARRSCGWPRPTRRRPGS